MARPVILCVDDEPLILESMKTELRSRFQSRFTYETAMDGREALDLIEELTAETTVAVVISDWKMPGLRGDEFLSLVHERWPRIKTILITGHADPDVLQRFTMAPAAPRVLSKPWVSSELLGLVEELYP